MRDELQMTVKFNPVTRLWEISVSSSRKLARLVYVSETLARAEAVRAFLVDRPSTLTAAYNEGWL